MKYLLDTNIFIFLIDKDYSKISEEQQEIISNSKNILLISEATLFEIAIKIRLGKPNFSRIKMAKAEKFRQEIGIQILKSDYLHYENIVSIPKILKTDGKPHADPFDLLIIATAQKEKIPVLSSDTYFPKYQIIKTIS